MKSFTDLNNYANTSVSYNSQLDYVIVWSASAGNVSVTKYEGEAFVVPKQIDLISVSQVTRDILLNLTISTPAAVAYVEYRGSDTGISVVYDDVETWTVLGIRTVAEYNDVLANLYVAITPSSISTFTITVDADDQMGSGLETWLVTVTSIASPIFSAPASFTYNEDTTTALGNISITETYIYSTNYTITINTENSATSQIGFAPGNVAVNSFSTTNTKANINSQLANLVFIPGADFNGNTYIDTTVLRTADNVSSGKRTEASVAVIYPDYTAPTGYAWGSNAAVNLGVTPQGNLAITDTAIGKSYSANLAVSPTTMGNLFLNAVSQGNSVTLTGNLLQVNANIANVTFVGNTSANLSGNISYIQIQTTDGITQANITIPMSYQIPAIHVFSNIAKPFGTRIDGANITANVDFWAYQYQTITQASGMQLYYSYTFPTNANVALSVFRDTTSYRFSPPSIIIKDRYGIGGRLETKTDTQGGYIAFWIKMNKNHQFATYLVTNDATTGFNDTRQLSLMSWNNQLYWFTDVTTYTNERIYLGANPTVGTWTHIALQFTQAAVGSQVASAWRDGVPVTQFYSTSNTLQTGTNWSGRTNGAKITGFVFGAPNGPPVTDISPNGFNNAAGRPFLDIQVDDIVVRSDAPYTNLASFTPAPVFWGGNVTQMVTGI